MRVVYYVYGWPPSRVQNGIVSAVSVLAPAMRALGHDARVLTSFGDPSTQDGSTIFLDEAAPKRRVLPPLRMAREWVSPRHDQFVAPGRRIARAVGDRADIIEIEESFGWSAIVAKRSAAAVVTRLHGPWFINGPALRGADGLNALDRRRIQLEGRAISRSEAVSAPSKYVLDCVRAHYGIKLENAAVIPNAVDIPDESSVWRPDRANWDEILFVGRFDRLKGADVVLKAFAKLAAKRPALRLTFVGPNEEPIDSGGGRLTCREFVLKIMERDGADRVHFTGPLTHGDIAPLRRRAAVTLIASLSEVFPAALLEAMAVGCPIVMSAAGGMPEIARNETEAVFFAPGDDAAMAAGIERLLDNRTLAEQIGRNARLRAANHFAPERVAAICADYYSSLRPPCGGTR